MIEKGYEIPAETWQNLKLTGLNSKSDYIKLVTIYEKCISEEKDSSVPCSIALFKVNINEIINKSYLALKVSFLSEIHLKLIKL